MKSTFKAGREITELLLKERPAPRIALDFSNPFELLVATILSAQCTDKRVNEISPALFSRYPDVNAYADADTSELERYIFSTGFYRNKARAIKGCATALIERHDGMVPDNMDELVKLPGVGRKTANVILAGAFGRQAIPVDTHIIRVSNRLGLAYSKNPEIIERQLMETIPEDSWTAFTTALILHGREICKARRPLCGTCCLFTLCPWDKKDGSI